MPVARQRTVRTLSRRAYLAVAGGLLGLSGPFPVNQAMAACTGPGAPTTPETKCVTGIFIPGNPLRSFDISWVNPQRGEYYLGDRSNAGIDVIDTETLKWKRTIGGVVGIALHPKTPHPAHNNPSRPEGVASPRTGPYARDRRSTPKTIHIRA